MIMCSPVLATMAAFQMEQWMPYLSVKDTSHTQSMDSALHSVTTSLRKPTPLGAQERKPLAHKLADKAEAAYQRGDLLEKRTILMQIWANYCYPTGEKVIQMPTEKTAS